MNPLGLIRTVSGMPRAVGTAFGEAVGDTVGSALDRVNPGRRHRRFWVGDGRAHIEVRAVRSADLEPGIRVWVAGEAAAMQRIRRHLFEDRGLPRSQASVRGYWKHGRSGDADAAADADS